ncbi:hypothetical protein BSL78_20364 [Apostichopus japonicus]|uniref:Uncharacterized protein n=1 Tax=Stichopus japonicus TaxID=307972 RepID=A0A2G8K461_STIJA|nr:hypothetical protein BSL78_20364 [Apostichopus japonicus]
MKETLPPLGGGINFEAGDKYISVCRGNLAPAGFPFGLGVCPYYPVLGAQQLLISSVPGSGTDSWDPEWNLGSALPVRSRWTRGLVGPGPPEPIFRVPLLSTRTFCPFRSEFQMGYLLALSLALAFPLGHRIRTVPGPCGGNISFSSLFSPPASLAGLGLPEPISVCVPRRVPLSSTRTFRPFRSELLKGFLLALSLAFLGSEGNVCSGLLLRSRRTLALRSPSLCAHHNGCRSLRPGRTVRSGRLCHGLLVGLEPCPCPLVYIRTTPAPWVAKSASLSLSHMGFWLALSLALALALGGTSGQRRHLGWQISISLSLSSPALSWPLSISTPTNSLTSSSSPVSPPIPSRGTVGSVIDLTCPGLLARCRCAATVWCENKTD